MDEETDANVFGRLTALELLITNLMTAQIAMGYPDPIAGIDEQRRDMFSSLQLLERPADERHDRIWEQAVESLELRFDNVRKRLVSIFRPE